MKLFARPPKKENSNICETEAEKLKRNKRSIWSHCWCSCFASNRHKVNSESKSLTTETPVSTPILDLAVDPLENPPNVVLQPNNLHGWKYYDPDEGENISCPVDVDPGEREGEDDDKQNSLPIRVSFNMS